MSSQEADEILQDRLQRLPEQTQCLLQYAACLGPTIFSASTLDIVWKAAPESKLEDRSGIEMTPLLVQCENEMLIEKCSGEEEEYQWKDDKIREKALTWKASRITEFQFRAGMALLSELSEEELQPKLSMVVDLVNNGKITQKSEAVASLNLKAARKARDLSDLESASVYAAKGIGMLPSGKRLSNITLALELYTIGAQIEMMLGNTTRVEAYTTDFLRLHDWTVMEAMPVRIARARTIATVEMKYDESIDEYLMLLKQLGCRLCFGRRFASLQAKWTLSKTIKTVKKKKRAFFEKLRPVQDEQHKAIAVLLCQVNNAAYHINEKSLAVLCTCKSVQLSLQHGLHHDFSGPSLTALGDLVDCNSTTSSELFLYDIGSILQQKHHDLGAHTYRWYGNEWTKP